MRNSRGFGMAPKWFAPGCSEGCSRCRSPVGLSSVRMLSRSREALNLVCPRKNGCRFYF